MKTQKKFKVVTLGCRTNQYESQAYADQLRALGYAEVEEGEVADLCIVNTCSVTESADSSSRHQIRRLARENLGARLVVTGCSAEGLSDEIKEIAEVDMVVPNKDKAALLSFVFPDREMPEFSIKNFAAHTRAFVKVQDGCNSFCTYCIIPYVRGRSRSRKLADIVREIEGLVSSGYKEVVLTGINVGDFDGAPEQGESPVRLAELIRSVDQIKELKRLRISSIDPDEVDDELAEAILHGRITCPSMHIVLQAGSNVILKKMNRKYTRQIFLETVERLRAFNPDFTFTTDIIVGFPGETQADFEETLEVMRQVKFAKVHMFPYSERARTRAALYPNKVPKEIIDVRKREVLRLSEQLSFEERQKYVGRCMSVLLESEDTVNLGFLCGHTANFLPVLVPKTNFKPNDLVEVYLQDNTSDALIGKI